jgi:hypothetical protein
MEGTLTQAELAHVAFPTDKEVLIGENGHGENGIGGMRIVGDVVDGQEAGPTDDAPFPLVENLEHGLLAEK